MNRKKKHDKLFWRGIRISLLVVLILLLAACGGNNEPADNNNSTGNGSSDGDTDTGDTGTAAEDTSISYGNFNPNYGANVLHELAMYYGWLEDGGITEHEVVFAEQSNLFPGLIGGSLDVVVQDTDAVAGAALAGEDLLIIAIMRDKEPWMLAFKEGIDINNLEGVTCSAGGAGGRNEFNSKEMVRRMGGDPDDIEWIPIGGGSDARVIAFAEGQIDCVNHFDRHRELVIEGGGVTIYDELENVPQDGFVVMREYAEANPRTIVNYLKGLIQARDMFQDLSNRDEIVETMGELDYEIPEEFIEIYGAQVNIQGVDGHFEIAAMEALISGSVLTGSLESDIDWRTFIDMSYLNQAYRELGMLDRVVDYGE